MIYFYTTNRDPNKIFRYKETPVTNVIGVSGIDQNLRSWFRKHLMKRVAILSKSLAVCATMALSREGHEGRERSTTWTLPAKLNI